MRKESFAAAGWAMQENATGRVDAQVIVQRAFGQRPFDQFAEGVQDRLNSTNVMEALARSWSYEGGKCWPIGLRRAGRPSTFTRVGRWRACARGWEKIVGVWWTGRGGTRGGARFFQRVRWRRGSRGYSLDGILQGCGGEMTDGMLWKTGYIGECAR